MGSTGITRDSNHEPDPRFLDHLEWQIQMEQRRKNRFAQPTPGPFRAIARYVALVALSLSVGAASVVAHERIQGSREQDLLLMQADLELEKARLHLEAAHRHAELIQQRVDAGIVSSQDLGGAHAALIETENELRRRELDREEIRASGVAVRNDLAAPRVNDRDFVSERVALDRNRLRARLEVQQGALEIAEQLFASGRAGEDEVLRARAELMQLESELQGISRKLERRQAFLAGKISARNVKLMGQLDAAVARRHGVRAQLEIQHRLHDRVRALVEEGYETQQALHRSALSLRNAEFDLELLELEIKTLEERIGH